MSTCISSGTSSTYFFFPCVLGWLALVRRGPESSTFGQPKDLALGDIAPSDEQVKLILLAALRLICIYFGITSLRRGNRRVVSKEMFWWVYGVVE